MQQQGYGGGGAYSSAPSGGAYGQQPPHPSAMTAAGSSYQQQIVPGATVINGQGNEFRSNPNKLSADDDEEVRILPLGSGNEVGRSCIVASYRGKNVMFDCGVHPAYSGVKALPEFEACNLEEIDILLITHFHLDHCAALPYILHVTKFKGKVFMTSATKAFFKTVLDDFASIGSSNQDIINTDWIADSMKKIEEIEYHQEKSYNGIRFQAFRAGHVLGAAMFQIDIAGVKMLYTGDYSMVPDRHLNGAEVPPVSPDILIVESTYGIQVLDSRESREEQFLSFVTSIVKKNQGRCLIPVFALGRAQELLLILEEHWKANPDLQHVKLLYASNMAQQCLKYYKRFTHSMNDRVKRQQQETSTNPFDFQFIQPLGSLEKFQDSGPAVVIAAPGMLQNGISHELFKKWAPDRRNGVCFAGYCVEGTLAKAVQEQSKGRGGQVMYNNEAYECRLGDNVKVISFSAHSDKRQTSEFISKLTECTNAILVHGNESASLNLQQALTEDFKERGLNVHRSENKKVIKIKFSRQRTAKVLGSLATLTTRPKKEDPLLPDGATAGAGTGGEDQREVPEGQYVSGILLVGKDHSHIIVHPDEVTTFTGLQHSTVTQALVLPFPIHKSTQDVLDWLKLYFADSSTYSSVGVAKQQDGAVTGAKEEDVILVGAGLGGDPSSAGGGILSATSAVGPKGVLVKLRTDPNTAHTIASIVWKTSRLTDLIADVTSIALCRLIAEHGKDGNDDSDDDEDEDEDEKANNDEEGDASPGAGHEENRGPRTNARGVEDKVTLPLEVSPAIDRFFKAKCFHQMLSQFFPQVKTNLVTGDCRITCSDGEKIFVEKFYEIRADDGTDAPAAAAEVTGSSNLINGVSKANFNAVAQILKRVYLTLFPVPADFGWCECGEHHGEHHLVHQQEAMYAE